MHQYLLKIRHQKITFDPPHPVFFLKNTTQTHTQLLH